MKRLLVGLVILAVILPVTASAVEYCVGYNSYNNPFSCCSHGNCTWWSLYMRPDLQGICTGAPSSWVSQASNADYTISNLPVVGSIGVTSIHVMYTTAVADNLSFDVTEMGCESWNGARLTHKPAGSVTQFILFKDPAPNITLATQKIGECRSRNTWLGSATSNVHEWHPSASSNSWIYIRDYQNGSIVIDIIGGSTQAYAVSSFFRNIWASDHGCAGSNMGNPIGDRYSYNGGWRQDFQFGWVFQKTGFGSGPFHWDGTNGHHGPGVFQRNTRSSLYSYKLSKCYSDNGGRIVFGQPASGNGLLPYAHPIAFTTAIAIDLLGGTYSNPVILYDTQAPLYSSAVAPYLPSSDTVNQACELHGAIRGYWESHGRFDSIGYPFTDEIPVTGQPYLVKQRFIRRANGRWIGTELRYYPNGSVIAVNLFNQQKMGDEIVVSPDEPAESLAITSLPAITFAPNPMTVAGGQITLSLPRIGSINLAIYDTTGRHIRQIATTNDHPAGNYTFGWDGYSDSGQRVASGIYFVRLSTPDNINTQRIVILR
ncbi:MAG: FlgD immunoglobulin-like domain containing protein [Patescibacteria group bacterium]|jgi:surface antigen